MSVSAKSSVLLSSKPIKVFMFDMDHTLIDNDCDVSWKKFLIDKDLAPAHALEKAEKFYRQYVAGQLKLNDFLNFQLAEFKGRTPAEMASLAKEHCEKLVVSKLYADAVAEVAAAANSGVMTAICTSTNEVIARPVAALFGIEHIIATRLEVSAGVYTGRIHGIYCGGTGKVAFADAFCREHGITLSNVRYYGDSIADIPLLSEVREPVAVNPAAALHATAEEHDWEIRFFA